MPRAERLLVFCYDIACDKARRKVAARLEDAAVRVQESVFETRMPAERAQKLGESLAKYLGPGDSLRLYAVGAESMRASRAWGAVPMATDSEYWLL